MAAPTTKQIREWSKAPFSDQDYAPPEGADPDPLDIVVERAIEYVQNTTGRDFDDPPEEFKLTLNEAVQRATEYAVFAGNEEAIETAGDFDLIGGFAAGPYNEKRRDLGEADKQKVIHPWPLLNALLWAAMTEDKKDDWREKWGQVVPAFAVTEVDWFGTGLAPFPSEYGDIEGP